MADSYYFVNRIAAVAGEYTVVDLDAGYDYIWFEETYVTRGRTTIDLGVMGAQGLSAVVTFAGSDGLARKVTVVAEIDRVHGSRTADLITGNDFGNFITGDYPFSIYGAADTIRGGGGNDTIYGYVGNDKIFGDAGNDICLGGSGNDTMVGGEGNDYLIGDVGQDVMTGGRGADVFLFSLANHSTSAAMDVIRDFSTVQKDIFDLRQIDSQPRRDGDQAFTFITGDFTGGIGELRVRAVTGGVVVEADIDRNRVADFAFLVEGVTGLTAADFLL